MLPLTLAFRRRCLQCALLLLLVAALGGCSSTQHTAGGGEWVLPDYSLRVYQVGNAQHDDDGYELMLRFELVSSGPFPFDSLVQEIEHETVYNLEDGTSRTTNVTLVEAFRLVESSTSGGMWRYELHPFQRDRHFESGFATFEERLSSAQVLRSVSIYPAKVLDADYTELGFAHLPRNRSGSVLTRVPTNFNRRYQEEHITRGTIVADDRVSAQQYRLHYGWKRSPTRKIETTFRYEDSSGVNWPLSDVPESLSYNAEAAEISGKPTGVTIRLALFNQLADEVR